jgi:hypothetical protein
VGVQMAKDKTQASRSEEPLENKILEDKIKKYQKYGFYEGMERRAAELTKTISTHQAQLSRLEQEKDEEQAKEKPVELLIKTIEGTIESTEKLISEATDELGKLNKKMEREEYDDYLKLLRKYRKVNPKQEPPAPAPTQPKSDMNAKRVVKTPWGKKDVAINFLANLRNLPPKWWEDFTQKHQLTHHHLDDKIEIRSQEEGISIDVTENSVYGQCRSDKRKPMAQAMLVLYL